MAKRKSGQAGIEAFEAQRAAAHVLLEAAWAEQENVTVLRKAELRAQRHVPSAERRRRYNSAWMRGFRARRKADEGHKDRPGDRRANLHGLFRGPA